MNQVSPILRYKQELKILAELRTELNILYEEVKKIAHEKIGEGDDVIVKNEQDLWALVGLHWLRPTWRLPAFYVPGPDRNTFESQKKILRAIWPDCSAHFDKRDLFWHGFHDDYFQSWASYDSLRKRFLRNERCLKNLREALIVANLPLEITSIEEIMILRDIQRPGRWKVLLSSDDEDFLSKLIDLADLEAFEIFDEGESMGEIPRFDGLDADWIVLIDAFHDMYQEKYMECFSSDDLFRRAVTSIEDNAGEILYTGLENVLTDHINHIHAWVHGESTEGIFFWEELQSKWTHHEKVLLMIQKILCYMDSTFVQEKHKSPVYELGVNLWKHHIINSSQFQTRISQISCLIENDKCADLWRIYGLFGKMQDGLILLGGVMDSYLREKPLTTDFVQSLLHLKDKIDKIISSAFGDEKIFKKTLVSALQYHMKSIDRFPEFISIFMDKKLKGVKSIRDEEDLECIVDKVMFLLHWLQEKDVFEVYFRQQFAKRILSSKVSLDAEERLISKLRYEFPHSFISKLMAMLKDVKVSEDIMVGYHSRNEIPQGPKTSIQILTTSAWPIESRGKCNLPVEISLVCEEFEKYYVNQHKSRKLPWVTHLGTADLEVTVGGGQKYQLNVSTYQMCVLVLFNDADRLTCSEIEEATAIPAVDLKRCLQSLACVKGKNVLRKEPTSKDIQNDDVFFFNDKFTSKSTRIKIGTVSAPTTKIEKESKNIRQTVVQDRRYEIDAAIVRIMKSRKVMEHNDLVAEIKEVLQNRFLLTIGDIKKRIDDLINREYLERKGNQYFYLA